MGGGAWLESSLGKSANVELATLDSFVGYTHDIGPSSRSLREDITDPVLEFPGQVVPSNPRRFPVLRAVRAWRRQRGWPESDRWRNDDQKGPTGLPTLDNPVASVLRSP